MRRERTTERGTPIEVEAKFQVPEGQAWQRLQESRCLGPYAFIPRDEQWLESAYLDTATWSLVRARVALRLRRVRGRPGTELTGKWEGTVRAGVHTRPEVTVRLPRWPAFPLRSLPPQLECLVAAIVARRPLRPMVRIDVHRRRMDVVRGDRSRRVLAELGLDDVRAYVPGKKGSLRFAEAEVELRDGSVGELHDVARRLKREFGLVREQRTKLARALEAFYERPAAAAGSVPDGADRLAERALEEWREADRCWRCHTRVVSPLHIVRPILILLARATAAGCHRSLVRALERALELLALPAFVSCVFEASGVRQRGVRGAALQRFASRRMAQTLRSPRYFAALVAAETLVYGGMRVP